MPRRPASDQCARLAAEVAVDAAEGGRGVELVGAGCTTCSLRQGPAGVHTRVRTTVSAAGRTRPLWFSPAVTTATAPLDQLRRTLAGRPALPPLSPAAYARAHATYEAHSDQRALLADWLDGALTARLTGPGPRSVLSIGPGDGSVDAPLARSLAPAPDGQRGPLRWVAAEPDPVVGERCRARLADAVGPGGSAVLHPGPFATVGRTVGDEQVDVVLAVHSLYYVPDLAAAVADAAARLAPGGALVVLLAPLEELCLLTEAVASASHRWWSGDLPAALEAAGLHATSTRLAGRLDTTPCFDPASPTGREVLDFLVGADCSALDDAAGTALLDALAAIGTEDAGRRTVPHPVDAVVATRTR
jgi:SAM-dependent methyltransferase